MVEIYGVRNSSNSSISLAKAGKIFDDVWGKDTYPDQTQLMVKYSFDIRVVVARATPPRHPRFYPFLETGMKQVERTMEGIPLSCEKVIFYFPERWLSVVEQREFMYKLETVNKGLNLKRVDLLTSCPVMITDFFNEQILIIP